MDMGTEIRVILWTVNHAVEELELKNIAATRLGLTDFLILKTILIEGPLPVNTIGRKVQLTSGSTTTAVDRLETKKMVHRRQSRHDGRIFLVHLTSKGKRLITAAFKDYENQLEELFETLSPSERIVLVHLLKKVGSRAERLLAAK